MILLILSAGFLVGTGLLQLSSVSAHFFHLQLLWAGLGAAVLILFLAFDLRPILRARWFIAALYVVSVILLLVPYATHTLVKGARSWIIFGSLSFQPAELAKVALILFYASYMSRRHLSVARLKTIFVSFAAFAVPGAITLFQPALGSAAILFIIWLGILLVSGLPRRWVALFMFLLVLISFFGWYFVLKDFQRARVIGFLYPEQHTLSVNYSVNQAKIAIGSAGFWGKGYKQGTQTQLGFLTEPEGDFILAAFIEEWGIFGGLLIISALLALIFFTLMAGTIAEKNFDKLVCLGAAIMFCAQFTLNAGSATGLLPVVGVTFPFLSYGGSSLLTNFFLLSIIASVYKNKS